MNVLGIEERKADDAACRVEHALDREILGRLTQLNDLLERCPRTGSEWLSHALQDCPSDHTPEMCRDCLSRCVRDLEAKDD